MYKLSDKIAGDSKVILYGMGAVGKSYYKQLKSMPSIEIVCMCDRNPEVIGSGVCAPEDMVKHAQCADYIILCAYDAAMRGEMKEFCLSNGISASKIVSDEVELCTDAYFGQYGEDVIIKNIFDMLGVRNPRYMDIGCNHPVHSSNTYFLYNELNSRYGILIDANPKLIKDCKEIRPDDVVLNYGVSDQDGELDFYTHNSNTALGTFDIDALKRADGLFGVSEEIIKMKVPVITLQRLLDEHCDGFLPELLSMDIEGYEVRALSSVRAEGFDKNIVIVIEKPSEQFTVEFARRHGYFLYAATPGNYILVKSAFRETLLPM